MQFFTILALIMVIALQLAADTETNTKQCNAIKKIERQVQGIHDVFNDQRLKLPMRGDLK